MRYIDTLTPGSPEYVRVMALSEGYMTLAIEREARAKELEELLPKDDTYWEDAYEKRRKELLQARAWVERYLNQAEAAMILGS